MEYYLPEKPHDDFVPALVGFILSMLLSVVLGIFLGYGVRLYLGGDEEVALTYTYTERMAAAKTAFSADIYDYQIAAVPLAQDPGVRVVRAADGNPVVVLADGTRHTPEEYFSEIRPVETQTGQEMAVSVGDDGLETFSETGGESVTISAQDVIDAVYRIFAGAETALADYTDSAGDAVEDVTLWNIAADSDGNVYFYLYYDYAGFIAIAYNPSNGFAQRTEPIQLMPQWYFDYAYNIE